jgi:hypothetical protein
MFGCAASNHGFWAYLKVSLRMRQVRKWLPKPVGGIKNVMVQRPPELQRASA